MPKVVGIKLTDTDYVEWERQAKAAGLTIAKWARKRIEDRLTFPVDTAKPDAIARCAEAERGSTVIRKQQREEYKPR